MTALMNLYYICSIRVLRVLFLRCVHRCCNIELPEDAVSDTRMSL
jgi:hypothetical protein